MELTVKISEKEVRLKSSAALPLRYKAQFGRDLFADMAKMREVANGELPALDTEVFYNIVWALAKCADDKIPPVIQWVESFETFPIFEIFNQAGELVAKSMGTEQKNATAVENQ